MISTGTFDEYKKNELEFTNTVYNTILMDVIAARAVDINPFFMAVHAMELARLVIKTFPDNPDRVAMMAVFHAKLSLIQDEINKQMGSK